MEHKKIRKTILVIMIVLAMVCCLSSCGTTNGIIINCEDDCISVTSVAQLECTVVATVEYSAGKQIAVVYPINLEAYNSEIIQIEELNEDLFNDNAKIISATVVISPHQERMSIIKGVGAGCCLGMIIEGIIVVAVNIKKDNPEEQSKPNV